MVVGAPFGIQAEVGGRSRANVATTSEECRIHSRILDTNFANGDFQSAEELTDQ